MEAGGYSGFIKMTDIIKVPSLVFVRCAARVGYTAGLADMIPCAAPDTAVANPPCSWYPKYDEVVSFIQKEGAGSSFPVP